VQKKTLKKGEKMYFKTIKAAIKAANRNWPKGIATQIVDNERLCKD
jgi:hypothetical protein